MIKVRRILACTQKVYNFFMKIYYFKILYLYQVYNFFCCSSYFTFFTMVFKEKFEKPYAL